MLLGKRPRPPMRKTTSMTEFSFEMGAVENPQPTDQDGMRPGPPPPPPPPQQTMVEGVAALNNNQHTNSSSHVRKHQQRQHQYHLPHHQELSDTRYLTSMVSPRNPRRNSGDFMAETADFLRVCGLCKRRLGPGKDTYMYRGEIAFCSLECRQQQINLDERNEKCSLTSMKKDPPKTTSGSSESSGNSETVAAA